jgi:hypothetical protein
LLLGLLELSGSRSNLRHKISLMLLLLLLHRLLLLLQMLLLDLGQLDVSSHD